MDYDAELQRHNEALREACPIGREDRVLDIGCGTGQTTRNAARMAVAGSVVGVDIAASMIERARELAEAEGLRNATFVQANAEVHRFPAEEFDVVISRFGTMFFDDPVAAFANIAHALRPGGRLAMMVWQAGERNEWEVSIQRALAADEFASGAPASAPDPFSLAFPNSVRRILGAAGFADATFIDVNEPVYYGPDVAAALDWVCRFASTKDMLRRLEAASQARALERLRATLAAHNRGRGVWFDSRAWIITARRPTTKS